MERQKAFTMGFIDKLQQEIGKNPEKLWNQIESFGLCMQNSITRNQYLKLAKEVTEYSFSDDGYFVLSGQNVQGEKYDEMWIDQDTLTDIVLRLFYFPEEG